MYSSDEASSHSLEDWFRSLLSHSALQSMGHDQTLEDNNPGLGWLYYALTRVIKPKNIVVIGSFRGFSPLIFGRALQDNLSGGRVLFIDPSLADGFWKEPDRVRRYFKAFGIESVVHHRETTQSFCKTETFEQLSNVDILFIDGWHSYEQAKYEFDLFEAKLSSDGMVLLHDSAYRFIDGIYGRDKQYMCDVPRLIKELREREDLQVFDIHRGSGVAIVSRRPIPS